MQSEWFVLRRFDILALYAVILKINIIIFKIMQLNNAY